MSLDAPVHLNMHRGLSQSLAEGRDVWFSLTQRTLYSCWGERGRGSTALPCLGASCSPQGKGEIEGTQAWVVLRMGIFRQAWELGVSPFKSCVL